MRTIIFRLMILAILGSTNLHAQEDGLYWVSEKPTSVSIKTLQGQNIFLGERFTEKIDEVSLSSVVNDNSRFQMTLTQDKPDIPFVGWFRLALVLQNKCLELGGGPEGPKETSYSPFGSPTFQAFDLDFATRAAAYFKITPELRHRPDYQFKAKFATNPEGYPVSGPVMVTLEITNTGAKPFFRSTNIWDNGFWIGHHDGDPFTFTAPNHDVELQPRIPSMGGISQVMPVNPQESWSIPINVGNYLKFDKPGVYKIRGNFAFNLLDDADSPHYLKTLWDDVARAEFEVKIK